MNIRAFSGEVQGVEIESVLIFLKHKEERERSEEFPGLYPLGQTLHSKLLSHNLLQQRHDTGLTEIAIQCQAVEIHT